MAVVIRMKRTGRRRRPCYRITVTDSRTPRDGRVIENLGLYDPVAPDPENQLKIDGERANHWIALGAKPSQTVITCLKRTGAWNPTPAKKRDRSGRKKTTSKGTARMADKKARTEKKEVRRNERIQARKAAQAAASAAGEGGDE